MPLPVLAAAFTSSVNLDAFKCEILRCRGRIRLNGAGTQPLRSEVKCGTCQLVLTSLVPPLLVSLQVG